MENTESLFSRSIDWQSEKPGGRGPEYYAYVDGKKWRLRMNDFPEEPLFTLIVGEQTIDFDDRPPTWTLPRLDEEYGKE
jgi:hypothetical protein